MSSSHILKGLEARVGQHGLDQQGGEDRALVTKEESCAFCHQLRVAQSEGRVNVSEDDLLDVGIDTNRLGVGHRCSSSGQSVVDEVC